MQRSRLFAFAILVVGITIQVESSTTKAHNNETTPTKSESKLGNNNYKFQNVYGIKVLPSTVLASRKSDAVSFNPKVYDIVPENYPAQLIPFWRQDIPLEEGKNSDVKTVDDDKKGSLRKRKVSSSRSHYDPMCQVFGVCDDQKTPATTFPTPVVQRNTFSKRHGYLAENSNLQQRQEARSTQAQSTQVPPPTTNFNQQQTVPMGSIFNQYSTSPLSSEQPVPPQTNLGYVPYPEANPLSNVEFTSDDEWGYSPIDDALGANNIYDYANFGYNPYDIYEDFPSQYANYLELGRNIPYGGYVSQSPVLSVNATNTTSRHNISGTTDGYHRQTSQNSTTTPYPFTPSRTTKTETVSTRTTPVKSETTTLSYKPTPRSIAESTKKSSTTKCNVECDNENKNATNAGEKNETASLIHSTKQKTSTSEAVPQRVLDHLLELGAKRRRLLPSKIMKISSNTSAKEKNETSGGKTEDKVSSNDTPLLGDIDEPEQLLLPPKHHSRRLGSLRRKEPVTVYDKKKIFTDFGRRNEIKVDLEGV